MSKKLIAVAAAAALALTGLVGGAPANANVGATFHGLAADGEANGTALAMRATAAAENAATPHLAVPAGNFLIHTDTTVRTVIKVRVATSVGNVVTAASTGKLKIISVDDADQGADFRLENSADVDFKSDAGAQSLSKTATTDNVSFYVFTTGTTADSLTISKSGNTSVVFIRGAIGPAYNITATLPAVIPTATTTNNLIAKITDVFGNTITAATAVTVATTGVGVGVDPTGAATPTYSATEGGHGFKLTKSAAGGMAISLTLTDDPSNVAGLPAAQKVYFATTSVVDLSVQVTALTAQVAALTAQLAGTRTKALSVTKKKYNSLARKWNAQNRTARVALKK